MYITDEKRTLTVHTDRAQGEQQLELTLHGPLLKAANDTSPARYPAYTQKHMHTLSERTSWPSSPPQEAPL